MKKIDAHPGNYEKSHGYLPNFLTLLLFFLTFKVTLLCLYGE